MKTSIVIATITVALAAAGSASAQNLPSSIRQPPAGPGTETVAPRGNARVVEGVQADVSLGTGFSDTYGLGVGARVGYAMANGIYVGGAADYFAGHSVNDQSAHATFLGGEVGYKLFPTADRRWEIRPYVFGGPAFVTTVSSVPFVVDSKTSFAIQPGVLAAYHFGDAFIQADAKYLVTPSPTTLAVFAGAGMAF